MNEILFKMIEKHGYNPADVARATGIAPSSFTDWKKGRSNPKYDKLKLIADFLGVSVEELTEESDEIDRKNAELNDYLEELKNRSEMRMLFKVSKNATKEDIEKTVKMLEAWGYKDDGDCEGC